MDLGIVLTGAIGLLVAAGTYWIQKILDRREHVRARHYGVYVEMVEAICGLANSHNRDGEGIEEALSNYATAKMKFGIVASENTMKRFIAFDNRITSGEKVPHEEFDRYLAEFMKEVRIENLGKTGLSNDELISITPFGRSLDRRRDT